MLLATKPRFLRDYLQNLMNEMQRDVQTANDYLFSEASCKTYERELVKKYFIHQLQLHHDKKTFSQDQKTLRAGELPFDIFCAGRNPNDFIEQTILRCHLPISGDTKLLEFDPKTSNKSLPKLIIGNGEICFDVLLDANQTEKSTALIQMYIDWIQQQIASINNELVTYNLQLDAQIHQAVQQKQKTVNQKLDALKRAGISLKQELIQPMKNDSTYKNPTSHTGKYHSAAISYGGQDEIIATKINNFLKQNGVRTWFFPDDSVPGKKLHRTMTELANDHDRVILLCSQSSLSRSGVLNEIEAVLAREAKEGGSSVFIPVAIDDHVFKNWAPENSDITKQIKSRVIVSLDEDIDTEKSQNALNKLLKALLIISEKQG